MKNFTEGPGGDSANTKIAVVLLALAAIVAVVAIVARILRGSTLV